VNTERIKEYVMAMGDFSREEIEKYGFILEAAVKSVPDMLKDGADVNDARIMLLAAAKAYCKISCLSSEESGVTSFKAGDVSFSEKAGFVKSAAEEIYKSALADCREFLKDSGFAFLGV